MNPASKKLMSAAVFSSLLLAACSNANNAAQEPAKQTEETHEAAGHSMNHAGGEAPEDLKEAADPAFPVGSKAIIHHGHMDGMEGAEATIAGAYDTTVYTVTYTPAGGDPVENHKWVIHEEIEGAGEELFAPGDKVTLAADHMPGMQGASAQIDSAEKATVYMVDFTSATGEQITNHQWVTEAELAAK